MKLDVDVYEILRIIKNLFEFQESYNFTENDNAVLTAMIKDLLDIIYGSL